LECGNSRPYIDSLAQATFTCRATNALNAQPE
jgi:hypothetical protein